jgi:hyperosmotically inducible protein
VLTADIKVKMAADTTVNAKDLNVDTRNRVVTLTGNLDSEEAKNRALQLARDTKGVVKVVDMISVRTADGTGDAPEPTRSAGAVVDDAGITMKVKGRFLKDPLVQGLRIDVDTRDGVVYLTGSVASSAEKDKAIQIAKDTEGVKDVQANLNVGRG